MIGSSVSPSPKVFSKQAQMALTAFTATTIALMSYWLFSKLFQYVIIPPKKRKVSCNSMIEDVAALDEKEILIEDEDELEDLSDRAVNESVER